MSINSIMSQGFFSDDELHEIGFAKIGKNVFLDKSVRIYGANNIHLSSYIRIDAFSVLSASSAGLFIGKFVHLGTGVSILGKEKVVIEDFCGLSSKVSIFSSNDDYSGSALTNPLIPDQFRRVINAPVLLKKHVIVGSGSVILPGIEIGTGAAVGALSFVNKSVPDFAVVSGNPIRKIGTRDKGILDRENDFLQFLGVNKNENLS